ncbi:MAG TPA: FAD-dependent oxidoreductase [Steroidobacteraceae bacterium]|nr:FAD-dependent oxidoreductase [Steroidobacteraceae bacterium]
MKIAIVGSGIAGCLAAYRLAAEHDITVFEAQERLGGHIHTHDIERAGQRYRIDTGFIVFNARTYPRFCSLLAELGIRSQPSAMSFSVSDEGSGLEYNGTTVNSLFAQRRNLVRPRFWRMLRDIVRFNREATQLLRPDAPEVTLSDYLEEHRYSREFIEYYLVPMGSAIWSTDPQRLRSFPARFFVRFFDQHGMLTVNDRPPWKVVQGGSETYLRRLTRTFETAIRRGCPVSAVRRGPEGVWISAGGQGPERFDAAFLACHSDEALGLLADPDETERAVLGALPYQANEAVLHTDPRLLPRNARAWAAWNYRIPRQASGRAVVTYHMGILQSLHAAPPFLVTLNDTAQIDPSKILARMTYTHPLFTREGIAAQARHRVLNGVRRTYYCGAYWGFGFHEDAVVSAERALGHFAADQKTGSFAPVRQGN